MASATGAGALPSSAAACADPTSLFRADFSSLDAYAPVSPLDVLAASLGLSVSELVKLDANENLYGPLPAVAAAVSSCDVLHIYPDPDAGALRRACAGFLGGGASAAGVAVGCGSDELLDLVLRLFAPAAVVSLPPTFGMYPFLAKIAAIPLVALDRGPAPDFGLDWAALRAAAAAGAAAAAARGGGCGTVVFAASPNNPTGGMLSHADVRRLCALPRALVVLDEAYAEFAAPGASAAALVPEFGNLVVLRTFSKWAALAGLRVGYSLSHAATAAALMALKQPYNVNVAADVGARAALRCAGDIMAQQVAPLLAQRARLAAALDATAWLVPVPTDANFVLFEVRPPFVAADVYAALRRRGVLTRYYASGRLRGCIRISTGRPEDIDRLLAAVAAVAAEHEAAHGPVVLPKRANALLWDMDGVLVDVAGSYRQAIVQTAAAFDAEGARARARARGAPPAPAAALSVLLPSFLPPSARAQSRPRSSTKSRRRAAPTTTGR